jgi:hypothetical protein
MDPQTLVMTEPLYFLIGFAFGVIAFEAIVNLIYSFLPKSEGNRREK